ncbi:MAG: ABC transporter permease [Coriobacteriia bacterium]|nr:ABC transporter permease [Coriobacteriia bacterium]
MGALLRIAAKDLAVLVRDKAAVLVMLAMPLGLVFILGSALGPSAGAGFDAKVAIVDLDSGPAGTRFVEGILAAEGLDEVFDIEVRSDVGEVRRDVSRGDLQAALVIPDGVSEAVAVGAPAVLEVLQDPGSQIAAGMWAGVARATASAASAEIVARRVVAQQALSRGTTPPVDLAPIVVSIEDTEVDTASRISAVGYYTAGMTGMFLLFGAMFGAFAFVRERREQTFMRMIAAPVPAWAIVGGKATGVLLATVGQFVVLLAGTSALFGVRWGAHPAAAVAVGVAESACAAGLAMVLAGIGTSERSIGAIAPAVIMLFAATGGAMLPVEALPAALRPLQVVSPVYWAVQGFLDVMRGASWAEVSTNVATLSGMAVVFLTFGIWRVSRR